MVLQDAQTRLFFKAQSVIQSEIRYYKPTTQDLAYLISSLASFFVFFSRTFSETRVAAQGTSTEYDIREKQNFSHLFEGAGLNQREIWFPTLSKTVWVLSQLHDFV